MKICFLYPGVYGEFPDIFEYTQLLSKNGCEVSFIGYNPHKKSFSDPNLVDVRHLEKNFFTKSIDVVQSLSPDLLHVFHFRGAWRIGFALSSRKQVETILDIRTLHVGTNKGDIRLSRLKDYITHFETLFFNHLLALTPHIKKRFQINKSKITVIPLGAFEYRNMHDNNFDVRSKFSIPLDAQIIIYVGTLTPLRNPKFYIESIRHTVRNTDQPFYFLLIGDDEHNPNLLAELKALVKKYQLEAYMKITGRLPYEMVKAILPQCDIGACYIPNKGSIKYQPATKILEYMSVGLKIVLNITKGNRLITKGYPALYEASSDTPAAFSRAIANALQEVNDHSITRKKHHLLSWTDLVKDYLLPYYKEILHE